MFFKITNRDENHHGMQYRTGLNTDILPFNPSGSCESGGIYFADENHICEFLYYGKYIREVVIPKGEQIYKEARKYKAHRVILRKRRRIDKVETWEWMVANGVDIHAGYESGVQWAASNGHLDVVKYLVEQGADIHAGYEHAERALGRAAQNGHLDVVKYLVEKGADIHAGAENGLCLAAYCGELAVVKYLVEKGANIHIAAENALSHAVINGHLDVVNYLVAQGADIHICNDIMLKYAVTHGQYAVAEYLRSVK